MAAGDVWTRYHYEHLRERAQCMAADPDDARVHLVMVPNPPYHRDGDFALGTWHGDARLYRVLPHGDAAPALTYASIGIFDTPLFTGLPRGVKLPLLPLLKGWIARGIVSAEIYEGPWANVGTPGDLAELEDALHQEHRDRI